MPRIADPSKPPKRKPADPVRDRPQDPGHGTPPVSHPGGGGGSHSPYRPGTGQHPPGSGGGYQGTYRPVNPTVIRRQQILRRAGFTVDIDGVWGPKSQAAWLKFTQGLNPKARAILRQGEIPDGFTVYGGRLVSKIAADAARAIHNARVNQRALHNQQFLQALRTARRPGGSPDPTVQHGYQGTYRPDAGAAALRNAKAEAGRLDAVRTERLFGVEGYKALLRDPVNAKRRLATVATPGDVIDLLGRGVLDIRKHQDIAVVQEVARRAGADVKVTGKWDDQTALGLEKAYAKQRAKDIVEGIKAIKATYYSNGIADLAARNILGHTVTPERFFAILQAGGPQARRLIRRAQNLWQWSTIPLDRYRQQQAQLAYLAKHGHWHPGTITETEERQLLPGAGYLFKSRSLYEMQWRMNVALDAQKAREEAKRAHEDEGFWSDAWDAVSGVLQYPVTKVGQGIQAGQIFIYRNAYAAGAWLNDVTDDNLSWVSHNDAWWAAGQFFHAEPGGEPVNTFADSEWRDRGFIDPHDAWIRGQITYDQWVRAHPLLALMQQSLIDPLNFVGGIGVGEHLFGLSARMRTISARAIASEGGALNRGVSGEIAQAIAIPHWFDHGADVVETLAVANDRLKLGLSLTPMGRAWRFAVRGRGYVISKITRQLDEDVARGFRDWAPIGQRILRDFQRVAEMKAPEGGKPVARVLDLGEDAGERISVLPPDLASELKQSTTRLIGALSRHRDIAPFIDSLRDLNTSLYRTFDRAGGELSQAGRELAAALTEVQHRLILDAVAHQNAGDDVEKLAEYLRNRGTAYAGHAHPDLVDQANEALDYFRDQLYDVILPHLDDIAREHLTVEAWDEAGRTIEGDTSAFIERLTGATYDDFVNEAKFEEVDNPFYDVPMSPELADRYIRAEMKTRKIRYRQWAEHRIWRNAGDEKAIDRITQSIRRNDAKIDAEVSSAWELGEDGLMRDTRATLRVPRPYARMGTYGEKAGKAWIKPGAPMLKHIADLAEKMKLSVEIVPPHHGYAQSYRRGWSIKTRFRHIGIPDPSTPQGYFIALHEIGHAATTHPGMSGDLSQVGAALADVEHKAWEWAIENAQYPITADVEAQIAEGLSSYWRGIENEFGPENRSFYGPLSSSPEQYGMLNLLSVMSSHGPGRVLSKFETPSWNDLGWQAQYHRSLVANAKAVMTPIYYRKEGLFLEALGSSQRRYVRGIYRILQFNLRQWKFFTLPGKAFGYLIRNTIDNYAKMLLDGYVDVRRWFNPDGHTLADIQVRPLMFAARVMDGMFGTAAETQLRMMMQHFWAQSPDVLDGILGAHGIHIPEELFNEQQGFVHNLVHDPNPADLVLHRPSVRPEPRTKVGAKWLHFQDVVWDLLGSRPENMAKRSIYVQEYGRAISEGATEMQAYDRAMAAVDRVLFDYSKVTVLESQLRVIFPFVLFWRKNATFWAHMARRKPWFYADAQRLYDAHNESNSDLPDWMARYVNVAPIGGALRALGADWLADWAVNAYADPAQYSSINAFYKAFKPDNQLLPPNQQGWKFVSGIADAFQDIGLGLNPFWRTTGEMLGVFNRRSWTTIFPQTSILQAFSQTDWLRDYFGPQGKYAHVWGFDIGYGEQGFNIEHALEDKVLSQIGVDEWHALDTQSFQRYVDLEIANQVAHGEKPNREKATEKIRGWLALQGVVSFVAGLNARYLTDTDIEFYALQQKLRETNGEVNIWKDLTPEQQEAYQLHKFTTKHPIKVGNPVNFDHYRVALEGAREFYSIDDWQERQAFLVEHPDIIPIVDPIIGGRIPDREGWVKDQLLVLQGDTVQSLYYDVIHNPEFAPDVRSAAYDQLVTPALKRFWAQNDTDAERRQDQIRGQYAHYLNRVQETYFSIPETDREARDNFLTAHPELSAWWQDHNSMSDDWAGVIGEANATFRDIYFRIVDTGDWDSANAFLKMHPHIFDFTSAEGRISSEGTWIPRSEAQKAYAAVAPLLRAYYELPESEQAAYLAANPVLRAYDAKYGVKGTSIFGPSQGGTYYPGGLSQHARDYLAVKAVLDVYFSLSYGDRPAYLDAHPELRAYFAKYARSGGGPRGMSQHARDYLAVKAQLDTFFSLPESERFAYLEKHPEVQAYFDKYGKHSAHGAIRTAADPELKARYDFWMRFFALSPDKRPAFIHNHAQEAGIFLYGSLSYDSQLKKEARWRREALAMGVTPRGYVFRQIKPLMDIYFSLKKPSDKQIFIQTNPELAYYFEHYAKHDGIPPQIVQLLGDYFSLQPYSDDRRQYLEDHPELKRYFNRDAGPKQKALNRMVEHYFSLPFDQKEAYVAAHPELAEFFDKATHQHELYSEYAAAFNEIDPRMTKYYAMYEDIIPLDALKRFELGWQAAKEAYLGDERIDRDPLEPKVGSPKKAGTLATRRDRSPS